MVTQLAKNAGLRVVATASRQETRDWCLTMGASDVIDHRQPLPPQLATLGLETVDFIFNASDTDAYWPVMAELIAPLGRICCLVDNRAPIPLNALKQKSATFAWEFMFTRAMFGTPDMARQGEILNSIAAAVDRGEILPTRTETLGPISAATLREAHARIESGKGIGKLVVVGWP
jgi:NADPH:quinone reductase-like Zn-dependent oxidoreductase